MTKVICLTGGIASGKSTAARFLQEQGAHVIDADVLGHRTYEPGSPTHAQVVAAFGRDILAADGRIDRKALGAKVFGRPAELKKLTDIVWPAIRALAEEEVAKVRGAGTARVIVLEAAVLFEAGWQDIGDEVWVNIVEREIAIARADVVIDNSGTPEAMLAQLRSHWQRINA